MKKRLIFDFALILLVISCCFIFLLYGGYFDKFQRKGVVNNYFSALSEGRYELAKTYCVEDGGWYELTESIKSKELPSYPITYTPNIVKDYGDFINVELVTTTTSILGINVRQTDNPLIFLTKEKKGLLGSWKLK